MLLYWEYFKLNQLEELNIVGNINERNIGTHNRKKEST